MQRKFTCFCLFCSYSRNYSPSDLICGEIRELDNTSLLVGREQMPEHFFNSELSYSKSKPQTWRPEGQKEPITIQRHIAAPQFNMRPLVSKVVGHEVIFEQHFLKSLFARLLLTIGIVWKLKKFFHGHTLDIEVFKVWHLIQISFNT